MKSLTSKVKQFLASEDGPDCCGIRHYAGTHRYGLSNSYPGSWIQHVSHV